MTSPGTITLAFTSSTLQPDSAPCILKTDLRLTAKPLSPPPLVPLIGGRQPGTHYALLWDNISHLPYPARSFKPKDPAWTWGSRVEDEQRPRRVTAGLARVPFFAAGEDSSGNCVGVCQHNACLSWPLWTSVSGQVIRLKGIERDRSTWHLHVPVIWQLLIADLLWPLPPRQSEATMILPLRRRVFVCCCSVGKMPCRLKT